MLAHLLMIFAIQSPMGAIPVGLKIPFANMEACVKWQNDPMPMAAESPFPLVVVHMECVNESVEPGKPV